MTTRLIRCVIRSNLEKTGSDVNNGRFGKLIFLEVDTGGTGGRFGGGCKTAVLNEKRVRKSRSDDQIISGY